MFSKLLQLVWNGVFVFPRFASQVPVFIPVPMVSYVLFINNLYNWLAAVNVAVFIYFQEHNCQNINVRNKCQNITVYISPNVSDLVLYIL